MKKVNIKKQIPEYVFKVSSALEESGYEAYLVGGSVRDLVMGRRPKDYDIATDARPDEILDIFPKAVSTGAKFGSIIVMIEDKFGESFPIDVTTYRVEEYSTGRWPSEVEFISSLEGDLARRDFTFNAMAVDLEKVVKGDAGYEEVIVDPFGGKKDIRKKVVKAVGEAGKRMKEDALRALRACRFASILDFDIEKNTKEAISNVLTMIDDLSAERVRDEFLKMLYDSPKPSKGLRLLKQSGIMEIWIPELLEGVGVEQPRYHAYDAFEHALRTVDKAEDSVKLAALFHDIAKPVTKTVTDEGEHFYGHDVKGEKITRKIMKRLKFSNKEIDRVARLVRWHMFYFPYDEDDFKEDDQVIRKKKDIGKWSDAAVRRFIRNVGGEDAVDELIKLRIADATANPKGEFDEKEVRALQKRIAEVRKKDMALKVTDLDIDGEDLIRMGMEPGPKIGKILKQLLEIVIEDPSKNDRDILLEKSKNLIKKYK